MGIFDTAKALGQKGLEAAKGAAEVGKTKLAIVDAESSINKVLAEVAKDVLENHADYLETTYPEQFAKIKELQAKIEELNAQLAAGKAE